MGMRRMKPWLIAGAVASLGLVGVGCKDRYDERRPTINDRGVGGSGVRDNDLGRNPGVIHDGEGPIEENKGVLRDHDGDGKRIGDGKIGRNNGVIDDGEGPLERNGKADDKIGKNPGVWHDGEGPIEERK